jgi:hypothetical protein
VLYSTPPFEERFADVWERCNSEVTRDALPDFSLVERELFVDMGSLLLQLLTSPFVLSLGVGLFSFPMLRDIRASIDW